MSAYVALLLVHLHFPDAGGLKARRAELQSVKAQLHGRHGLTVAEVDHQDVWQRSTLAAALTGFLLAEHADWPGFMLAGAVLAFALIRGFLVPDLFGPVRHERRYAQWWIWTATRS